MAQIQGSEEWLAFLIISLVITEFESTFSQKKALLGIAAMPPYAILTFLTLFLNISKLKAAQTDEISSSNLFETLYALKVFF